ncbi:MAG: hypothetical protein PHH19_02495 [Eubacteriales bacterium]|nr:hypothetical protein [Eubacteriales bacterium]
MLIDKLDTSVIRNYCKYLESVGMISGLSSDSESPYINSRVAENIFCMVTGALNLGRADCSVDAKLDKIGVGIKTFLANNNRTMQKIAEFNKDAFKLRNQNPVEIVNLISKLRNERILTTMRIYGLETMIYHCIIRDPNLIRIYECSMDLIDIKKIKNIHTNNNIISFEDSKNVYSFNLSKNTLYKRFFTEDSICSIKVEMIDKPFELLVKLITDSSEFDKKVPGNKLESIILPLFSDRGTRHVPERSGLNQWNAHGRLRNINEIYIPIPAWIQRRYPDFFPGRDISFNLELPNENIMSAKICQQGEKALMSNPNRDLGNWLLREVMNLEEGELLTYDKLQDIGIDSVEVYKIDSNNYKIDFRSIGTFDEFYDEFKRN